MVSTYALASGGGEGGTDIVQRTVNFVLFAGLVWYLVADPVKSYFKGRSQGIANELQKVKDRLKESDNLKKEALAKVSEAEKFAAGLKESAKKENKILNDNIMAQCEKDLVNLEKTQKSHMEFEQRKMVRRVVETIITKLLDNSNSDFDKQAMANVILKKVA
jgi:F-type H+-transporting ATPase subunit b